MGLSLVEIKGPGKVESSSVRRASRPASGGGSVFSLADAPEAARAPAVSGPGPLTAVDSILMLQGVDDSLSGRSKGLAHGEDLLDMLDEVRDGLLAGGISRTTLNKLATAVSKRQEGFADPKLQNVLDEIELRAKVELAKLEQADQQYA
ncbi:MAG TPA: flagellar assembly protein FliX [Rhizomicrobium sp.]|jgi:hypothetical protein